MSDFFFFAGEQSADMHGSHILRALKEKSLDLSLDGVFGPNMRAVAGKGFLDSEEFQVMGFSDVIKALPRLKKHFKAVLNHILATKPKTVFLIDYPGFNLRLAKALKKRGYSGKIIHFICPSVWAWKKNRIQEMEKNLDLLLCIFPFEPSHFANTHLKALYVGNPSLEYIQSKCFNSSWRSSLGIPDNHKIISLFPGSREGEIVRNFPFQLEAALLLQKEFNDASICISIANDKVSSLIHNHLKGEKVFFVRDNLELMHASHIAIAKCGTVTLELALSKVPTVVTYGLSKLNAFLARYIFRLRLPFYCIANILLKKEVFTELIHKDFTPKTTYQRAKELYTDEEKRVLCKSKCSEVIDLLKHSKSTSDYVSDILTS